MSATGLAAFETVYAQYWYRDMNQPFGATLTGAVEFTLRP